MPAHSPHPSARETMLTVLLIMLVLGGFVVFFVGIMGVFILHAIMIVGVMALFGTFHYLVWGRSLSQEVAPEQEEAEPPLDADGWPLDGPHGPTRY
jgi:hypothetical protein